MSAANHPYGWRRLHAAGLLCAPLAAGATLALTRPTQPAATSGSRARVTAAAVTRAARRFLSGYLRPAGSVAPLRGATPALRASFAGGRPGVAPDAPRPRIIGVAPVAGDPLLIQAELASRGGVRYRLRLRLTAAHGRPLVTSIAPQR